MESKRNGLVLGCNGGRYEIIVGDARVFCKAAGRFRHLGVKPLPGDRVILTEDDTGMRISDIEQRKNSLIRPLMANLDTMYVVIAASKPETIALQTDKLLCICEYLHIEPIILISKSDENRETAERLASLYEKSGFKVICTSSVCGQGIDELRELLREKRGIAAFVGASGVGKSSLLNALFPSLTIQTGALSEKIERGKNTTRAITLYPIRELDTSAAQGAYLADTPGFSSLDFVSFDFFSLEDLPFTFREFIPYLGKCRYTDCRHTGDEGCAIGEAVLAGFIRKERFESYCSLYRDLKDKKEWNK